MFISLRRFQDAAELDRLIRTTTNAKQRDRYRAVQLAIDAVRPVKPSGRPTMLLADRHEEFRQRVIDGPREEDGVCALLGNDIIRILEQEFGVSYSLSGVYDLLARLDLVVLAPRPKHRKSDPKAMQEWVERAPFLSATPSTHIQTSALRCGSRTKRASASRAR